MKVINGIIIEESDLTPLHDEEKRDTSLSYFFGVVTQIAFAETGQDVLQIWENARKHLQQVYLVSDYAAEDFHIFDMELARCSRRRAEHLNICSQSQEIVVFNLAEEREEMNKLNDQHRKLAAGRLFIKSVIELELATVRGEVLKIHEKFERDLQSLYEFSWAQKYDLPIWTYLMVKRLARVAKNLEGQTLGA